MTDSKDKNNLEKFLEQTKNLPPRRYLVDAMNHVESRGPALDLGAGALRDTRYLLQEGFEEVISVDKNPSITNYGKDISDHRSKIVVSSFEDFDFESDTYDLINAQYALPFAQKKSFDILMANILSSLKKDGLFVGTFFGDKDSWQESDRKPSAQVFLSREQILDIFKEFEILTIIEEEEKNAPVGDTRKDWHKFHITARKK